MVRVTQFATESPAAPIRELPACSRRSRHNPCPAPILPSRSCSYSSTAFSPSDGHAPRDSRVCYRLAAVLQTPGRTGPIGSDSDGNRDLRPETGAWTLWPFTHRRSGLRRGVPRPGELRPSGNRRAGAWAALTAAPAATLRRADCHCGVAVGAGVGGGGRGQRAAALPRNPRAQAGIL